MLKIIAFLLLYLLFVLIYVGFSIKEGSKLFSLQSSTTMMISSSNKISTINFNKTRKSIQSLNPSRCLSIYLKIFLNYAQLLALVQNLNLKWPPYVLNYLKTTGSIGTVSTQLFSLDCLIYDFNLNISAIYLKTLSTMLIYLGFLFAAGLYFGFKKFILKRKNQETKMMILVVVLSVLMQPNNIRDSSDTFVCLTINQKEYLREQMSLECYTSEHNFWVIIFLLILKKTRFFHFHYQSSFIGS